MPPAEELGEELGPGPGLNQPADPPPICFLPASHSAARNTDQPASDHKIVILICVTMPLVVSLQPRVRAWVHCEKSPRKFSTFVVILI